MSVIYAVVISFRDEKSVSIQHCLDKMFVYLINICAVGCVDEILNMLFDVQSAFWLFVVALMK